VHDSKDDFVIVKGKVGFKRNLVVLVIDLDLDGRKGFLEVEALWFEAGQEVVNGFASENFPEVRLDLRKFVAGHEQVGGSAVDYYLLSRDVQRYSLHRHEAQIQGPVRVVFQVVPLQLLVSLGKPCHVVATQSQFRAGLIRHVHRQREHFLRYQALLIQLLNQQVSLRILSCWRKPNNSVCLHTT